MNIADKGRVIVLIERLRLVESEIYQLSSKYGVKTIDELDNFIKKGKLTEERVRDDVFLFDKLLEEKDMIEKDLSKLSVNKNKAWENLQSLLGLRKLNFQK